MFLLFVWLAMGFVCYDVAKEKGLNCNTWALLGVIFGIFALMVLVMIPKKSDD